MGKGQEGGWVVDTSVYTHLARAGHGALLGELSPEGVVLVPTEVDVEIRASQDHHDGVPGVGSVPWARLTTLSDDEVETELQIKAAMGGSPTQHLGECAVIACAAHRGLVALIDERRAIAQADLRGVPTHDTLWLVVEAYVGLWGYDRVRAARVVDDLLATDMWLPVTSGEELFAFAYEQGWLPR